MLVAIEHGFQAVGTFAQTRPQSVLKAVSPLQQKLVLYKRPPSRAESGAVALIDQPETKEPLFAVRRERHVFSSEKMQKSVPLFKRNIPSAYHDLISSNAKLY